MQEENLVPDPEEIIPEEIVPCETLIIENFTYDTVYPSEYLMAYPGSWWEYSDGRIDSCFAWDEVSIYTGASNQECDTVSEDRVFLPRSSFGLISFESRVSSSAPSIHKTTYSRILGAEVGLLFMSSTSQDIEGQGTHGYVTHTKTGRVVELLDSLLVGGIYYYDIVHIEVIYGTYYSYISNGPPPYQKDFYYARGVGKVKLVVTGNMMQIEDGEYNLVNYNIAPH